MIDTVSLSHEMRPRLSDRQLMTIGANKPKGKTAYVINPADGDTMPALTWQTQPNGKQYLTARFSIPRQRWGHNARLPATQADIFAGLGIAADAIYRATELVFNPLTANVTGVDYAMDFKVGAERVRPILDRLELRQLPRHKRNRQDHGILYKQRQSSIQVYAKFVEVKEQMEKGHITPELQIDALQASDGVLRVEYRQNLPALDRSQTRLGLTRKASDVLTPDASHRVIIDTLYRLQFNDAVTNAESDQELDRLLEHHGDRVAMRLVGFLKMVKSYGADFWRVRKYSRRTYYDNLRLCKSAGVWAIDK